MRTLITGAQGFLGQYLLDHIGAEQDIYTLDQRKPSTKCIDYGHKIEHIEGDILRPDTFASKIDTVDSIIHLASVNKAINNREERQLYEVNTVGTLNMLQLAIDKGASSFVFASSAAVYGNKIRLPTKETFSTHPVSIYGLSKLICEQMCRFFTLNHSLSTICLRLSNMYGPGQGPGFVIPDLVCKFRKQNVVDAMNPDSTRDFIYVDDVAEAIVKCFSIRGEKSETINIGSGLETSIKRISQLLARFSKKEVIFKNDHNGGPKRSVLDINKAWRTLDWKPKVQLEEGIERVWAFTQKDRCLS